MRFLRCSAFLQIGATAGGVGGGSEGFLVQTAIEDGRVSCEQQKLQQGPAFIVHGQGLHSKSHPSKQVFSLQINPPGIYIKFGLPK